MHSLVTKSNFSRALGLRETLVDCYYKKCANTESFIVSSAPRRVIPEFGFSCAVTAKGGFC